MNSIALNTLIAMCFSIPVQKIVFSKPNTHRKLKWSWSVLWYVVSRLVLQLPLSVVVTVALPCSGFFPALFKDKSYSWIVTKIFNGWQQCSCSHKKLLLLNYNHPGVACIMESSKKKYTTTHIFTSNFKWIYNSLLGEKCSYVAPNHVQRCELQYLTNTDSAMNTKQSNVRILAQIFL